MELVSSCYEAQTRLDDEIAVLTSQLCSLRSQRNSLSPISRLPTEILSSIFIYYARTGRRPRSADSGVPDWVQVSYVCRHWRDVALNCPALWSVLFVSSQQWTDELLARCKATQLEVCVDSEYPKQPREWVLLKKVAPHADRIGDLTLQLAHREAERVLSLFSSPAPLLRRLRISVERSNYLGSLAALNLTGALFDGYTPALRNLELVNYAFPLTSPTLSGLTSLRLRDLATSFQPTLEELRIALSRMQNLVHLHLENALPGVGSNSNDKTIINGTQKLPLPQLSRFSIIAPFSTVVLLLACLDIPLKTQVRLRCCFEPGIEDYVPIYTLLGERFIASADELSSPIVRTCFIESASAVLCFTFTTIKRDSGRRAFSMSTTEYHLGELHEDWDCSIPLKADIVLPTALSRNREEVVGGVCRNMPLTKLESIHFSFDVWTALSFNFWRGSLGHLGQLRHIKLSEVSLEGLAQALLLGVEGGPEGTFAPALEELELYSTMFLRARQGQEDGTCTCIAMDYLGDALTSRQAVGHGLRLTVADCIYHSEKSTMEVDGVLKTSPGAEREKMEKADGIGSHRLLG